MLSAAQIEKMVEHLEKAQNPLFFFDNDIDGLASFLILRRYANRGKGVAIKSFPELDASYARKINELNADYVFVLDKPRIDEGFLKEALRMNIPVVWLDHHNIDNDHGNEKIYEALEKAYENLYIYNPARDNIEQSEPVSYLAYKVTKRKEDMWVSMMGCISDGFMPEFAGEFKKQYPDLWGDVKTAFQGIYGTEFGRIIIMLSFALKDRTSEVVKTLKFLINAKSPYDIREENNNTYHIINRYEQINKKYQVLLGKAKIIGQEHSNLLYFQYGGDFSLSADIANELFYRFPGKVIVVAYIKGTNANVSLRGNIDIRKLTLNAIKGIEGATGGGHEHACGAKIPVEELLKFRNNLEKAIK